MKSLTSSNSAAISRGINSSLKFNQVVTADQILAAAEGSRLVYGGKKFILPTSLESRRRFVLKLAGKL